MPKPIPTPYSTIQPPTIAEQEDVHAVYEAIAPHFSSTRYKPWPLVSSFLRSLPPNSIGLDSGAGNGKYVPLASEEGRMCWALDMSWGLLSVARDSLGGVGSAENAETGPSELRRGQVECLRGELGYEGWRAGVFDWAISIAAIHHLSTPQRRVQSVQALMRCLVHRSRDDEQPRSRFMIYVWAYEQGEGSKRKMGKRAAGQDDNGADEVAERIQAMALADAANQAKEAGREPGTDEVQFKKPEIVQDVLVPWVLQPARPASKRQPGQPRARRKKQAALDDRPDAVAKAEGADDSPEGAEEVAKTVAEEPKVYHRYYHLFLRGELRELVLTAAREDGYGVLPDPVERAEGGDRASAIAGTGEGNGKWMRVLKEGWEADNWWIECEVGSGGL